MASSLKTALHPGRAFWLGRRRPVLAPDLVLAPPRRTCARPNEAIPGTIAAYVWLAAGLVLAACVVASVLWLAVSLPIERVAPWSGWRAI